MGSWCIHRVWHSLCCLYHVGGGDGVRDPGNDFPFVSRDMSNGLLGVYLLPIGRRGLEVVVEGIY